MSVADGYPDEDTIIDKLLLDLRQSTVGRYGEGTMVATTAQIGMPAPAFTDLVGLTTSRVIERSFPYTESVITMHPPVEYAVEQLIRTVVIKLDRQVNRLGSAGESLFQDLHNTKSTVDNRLANIESVVNGEVSKLRQENIEIHQAASTADDRAKAQTLQL